MKKSVLCLLLLNVFLLASCQQKVESLNGESSIARVLTSSKIKEAKPGAEVSLASENIMTVAANTTANIEILLRAQLGDGDMVVELTPGEGLQLSNVNQPYIFTANTTGLYSLGLQLAALDRGRYYLNIKVTINNGDTSSSRILAVIVQVGDQSSSDISSLESPPIDQKLSPGAAKKQTGEAVISLPAEERITNQ